MDGHDLVRCGQARVLSYVVVLGDMLGDSLVWKRAFMLTTKYVTWRYQEARCDIVFDRHKYDSGWRSQNCTLLK